MTGRVMDRELAPVQRTLYAVGLMALVILVAGVIEYLHYEPPGQHTGAKAFVSGVYVYDPETLEVAGPKVHEVAANRPFAAVIDIASVPDGTTIDARWLDPLGNGVGAAGPADVAALRRHPVVAVIPPDGLSQNLPGRYTIVIERWSGGRPVEVLDRTGVLVTRPV